MPRTVHVRLIGKNALSTRAVDPVSEIREILRMLRVRVMPAIAQASETGKPRSNARNRSVSTSGVIALGRPRGREGRGASAIATSGLQFHWDHVR